MCSKQNRRFKSKRFQHDSVINELKTLTKHVYHTIVNVNLMEENVIQIKNGIMINVDVVWKT